ncbi:transient receptor potential cation channel subfamily M member-like 2 [Oppia nitens]|uniref:transient receptor potential cation channel subfamily M member-like 2 n=1 Tax=Oppia nitens TaxID=1686743 RepID=UPI0023D9F55A|nr:transient receptor potential cation channel subfamily M member-like 2 [Oppia nitens]
MSFDANNSKQYATEKSHEEDERPNIESGGSDSSLMKKPVFRSLVTRLQIASRLARNRRNSFEEENDVVADEQEIKNFARITSPSTTKKTSFRPRNLTLRQFSQISNGSNSKNYKHFLRNGSKVSDLSVNEDDEYENGIISDGIIHFSNCRQQFSYNEAHPFLRVTTSADIEFVAQVMHKCWTLNVPKIVTFILSNKSHSTNWTNERQIKNFQKGLIKAAISTNMWIFTNGIDSGVANLVGNAVKNEINRMRIMKTLKNHNLTNLIGIVAEEDLRYGALLAINNKEQITIENEGIVVEERYELNDNHTHFIIIKDRLKYDNCVDSFIIKFAQLLTRQTPTDKLQASTPDSLDAPFSVEDTEVPVVSILIEGDCQTVKLVVDLIKRHIPVVILRGTGGIADIIAFAYLEICHRCPDPKSWDLEFIDQCLKPMLTDKIIQTFNDLKDNTLTRNLLRDRIIECVRLCRTEDRIYLTVLNLHNTSSRSLENLSQHLLLALLKSRHTKQMNEMVSSENFLKDLELTMDWNCPEVANNMLFVKNSGNTSKLDKSLFESALIRPNREEFIDLFLSLGFQIHKFLSPSRLSRIFKLIHDNDFYSSHCWENILSRPSSVKQPKNFIESDLNWLIEILTGLDNYVDIRHLSYNVMGLNDTNSESSERRALNLLTFWAVMQNRDKLVKVFWKHSDHPVHLALVISMMFDRLSWYAVDNNMKTNLRQKSREFADFANGALDICYNEDITRANNVLNQSISDWGYKTAVDIAANAQLRQFLAHPCCQKFLTNTFLGNIRIRELNWGIFTVPVSIKILLCAFFIFPLFIWIRFKNNDMDVSDNGNNEEEENIYDDIYSEDYARDVVDNSNEQIVDPVTIGYVNPKEVVVISDPKATTTSSTDTIISRRKNGFNYSLKSNRLFVVKQPPLSRMLVTFFSAPITKFYVSQLFYLLFLPLLSLSAIYPGCGSGKIDLLVCIWTTVLTIDYIRRTYILIKKYTAVPVFLRCLEINSVIVFIILFSLTRVFNIHVITPYQQKLMLCAAVLYFYYRLIGIYLPISPTLGPLLHRLKLMITVDFVNYMRIALLIILSNMIVMQAVLYPDTELSVELFHKAFHRAFFALFLTPVTELETNEYCEENGVYKGDEDYCTITGKYNMTSCANTGVWAYAFFIQYLVFLKLILSTLLMAIFAATASKLSTETDNIWKFQRYLLVIDFENRLPLPAPFSILNYIYFIFVYFRDLICNFSQCCINKKTNKVFILNSKDSQERNKLTPEECAYWRQLASDFIKELHEKAAREQIPLKQWEQIQVMSEDMEYQKKILREIKSKVKELERTIYRERFVSNVSNSVTEQTSGSESTCLSHYSPYPSTQIKRVPLSEQYIPWEVLHTDYEPIAYSKTIDEFPNELKGYVDEDIIHLNELKSRNSGLRVKLPKYEWNSMEKTTSDETINRISWMINDNGSSVLYKLEDNLIPRNPFGRTGLRGRGAFPRWGPNHYVILVITRWQKRSKSPSKVKNLELVVETVVSNDQYCLPERFVSGDDLFGEIQKLFKIESIRHQYWVLPEVVNFFKSACKQSSTEYSMESVFDFKLIHNGYIDDYLNTDNAWKEAKVWQIHYKCVDCLKQRFDERRLEWRLLSDSLFSKMPLSHSRVVKSLVDTLNADII